MQLLCLHSPVLHACAAQGDHHDEIQRELGVELARDDEEEEEEHPGARQLQVTWWASLLT